MATKITHASTYIGSVSEDDALRCIGYCTEALATHRGRYVPGAVWMEPDMDCDCVDIVAFCTLDEREILHVALKEA